MKKHLLTLSCLLATATLYAAPYPRLDPNSLINGSPERPPITVNIQALQNALGNLSMHAGDYPPQFDSDADRQQAINDLAPIAIVLDNMTENSAPSAGGKASEAHLASLLMSARLAWIGHNLDQPGYGEKAEAAYRQLLQYTPANRKADIQDEFGRFLASVGKAGEAVENLRAAYKNGNRMSAIPLAMALLAQDKRDESVKVLKEYTRANPNDPQAQEILGAIESGQIQVQNM